VVTRPRAASCAFSTAGQSAPCYGSGNDNLIYERPANGAYDKIIMKGGHDLVRVRKPALHFSARLAGSSPMWRFPYVNPY
jgi:hypothetical protein